MFCKIVEMMVILIEENQKRAIRIINSKRDYAWFSIN